MSTASTLASGKESLGFWSATNISLKGWGAGDNRVGRGVLTGQRGDDGPSSPISCPEMFLQPPKQPECPLQALRALCPANRYLEGLQMAPRGSV